MGWLTLHPSALPQRKKPGTHFTGRWMGLGAGPDGQAGRQITVDFVGLHRFGLNWLHGTN